LLIDFSDLASLDTLAGLLAVFHRPKGADSFLEYEKSLKIAEAKVSFPIFDERWVRKVIAGLYVRPRRKIVIADPVGEVDSAVMAIWSQQWPRLRRNFRFCTYAVSDRTFDSAAFDFQILPSTEKNIRFKFSDVVDAEALDSVSSGWLDAAIQDLKEPDSSGLRTFFRRFGADVNMGREGFSALCRLYLDFSDLERKPSQINNAIIVLEKELGPKQAGTARISIVNAALKCLGELNERSLFFLWENVELLDTAKLRGAVPRVGELIWTNNPSAIISSLEGQGNARLIAELTLASLDVDSLVSGMMKNKSVSSKLLLYRPEVLGSPLLWDVLEPVEEALQIAKINSLGNATILAIFLAKRDDLIQPVIEKFGVLAVLQCLSATIDSAKERLETWLLPASRDTFAIAEFLASQSEIPFVLLYKLARLTSPDSVPNDYGVDPWLIAFRSAIGTLKSEEALYLAAYFLSRSLGRSTRSSDELALLGFEEIYFAAADSRMSESVWGLLEPRLPRNSFWLSWDRCTRIIMGVVNVFIERNLSPTIFCKLVQSDRLFSLLVDAAADSSNGRRYLRRACNLLMDSEGTQDAVLLKRIKVIADAVD
jgi:hypothetical protein